MSLKVIFATVWIKSALLHVEDEVHEVPIGDLDSAGGGDDAQDAAREDGARAEPTAVGQDHHALNPHAHKGHCERNKAPDP